MYFETIVDIEDMAKMSQEDTEAFALNRRKGFGASDSGIILGVNKWTTLDQLIEQKNTPYVTEDEILIGMKPQVRMGSDLEPLILDKAAEMLGVLITKPTAQYRFKDYPFLTVNYDGIYGDSSNFGIVEAKCVSTYARKYWDFTQEIHDMPKVYSGSTLKDTILTNAKMCGIPEYYYTQVQQQLLGTHADFAYLAAMDVKEWTVHIFKIPENEYVQQVLIGMAASAAEKCTQIPLSM